MVFVACDAHLLVFVLLFCLWSTPLLERKEKSEKRKNEITKDLFILYVCIYIYIDLAFSHFTCACRYVFIVSFLQHYLLTKELFILNRHIPPKFVEKIEDLHLDMVVQVYFELLAIQTTL